MALNGKSALLKEIIRGEFGPVIAGNHPDIPLLMELETEGEIDLEYRMLDGAASKDNGWYKVILRD